MVHVRRILGRAFLFVCGRISLPAGCARNKGTQTRVGRAFRPRPLAVLCIALGTRVRIQISGWGAQFPFGATQTSVFNSLPLRCCLFDFSASHDSPPGVKLHRFLPVFYVLLPTLQIRLDFLPLFHLFAVDLHSLVKSICMFRDANRLSPGTEPRLFNPHRVIVPTQL